MFSHPSAVRAHANARRTTSLDVFPSSFRFSFACSTACTLAPPKPNELIARRLFRNLNDIIQIIINDHWPNSYAVFLVTTSRRPSVRPGISVFGD